MERNVTNTIYWKTTVYSTSLESNYTICGSTIQELKTYLRKINLDINYHLKNNTFSHSLYTVYRPGFISYSTLTYINNIHSNVLQHYSLKYSKISVPSNSVIIFNKSKSIDNESYYTYVGNESDNNSLINKIPVQSTSGIKHISVNNNEGIRIVPVKLANVK